ncbi:DUF2345 domain-containing protein, partial [Flavobacterium sp.]|uniref:DUF2345 domain-containing protein n=1 Tax=Flavobacterium sp. TaxID=239 RepID=UPI0025C479B4
SLQSQSDKTTLTASQTLTIASTQASIRIAAPHHLLMTAQGAGIILEGGNITLTAPGTAAFKASMKVLAGAGRSTPQLPNLPKSEPIISALKPIFSQQFDLSHLANNELFGFSSEKIPYQIFDKNGRFITSGITNSDGLTDRILTNEPTQLVAFIGDGDWQIEEHFEANDFTEGGKEESL